MIDQDLFEKFSFENSLRIIINSINNLYKEIKMTNDKKLKFKKLNPEAVIPTYGTSDSAGFDFYCLEDSLIDVKDTVMIRTGLSVEIPKGYFMAIVPRSSTGLKTPLRLSNSMGIIDSDYRGELKLIFTNTSNSVYKVNKNDRLAQGFILPVLQMIIEESNELSDTERGEGGFGSTGR